MSADGNTEVRDIRRQGDCYGECASHKATITMRIEWGGSVVGRGTISFVRVSSVIRHSRTISPCREGRNLLRPHKSSTSGTSSSPVWAITTAPSFSPRAATTHVRHGSLDDDRTSVLRLYSSLNALNAY